MTGPSSIPDEVKWQIAAEFSAQLPALYDRTFRTAIGRQYDRMEEEIWMEAARFALAVAKNLSLPVSTAQDLAETLCTVMVILFGPYFKNEALELSQDGAVIIVRRCPLLSQGNDSGSAGERTFHKCMAFILTEIPLMNKDFSARFVRTMCTGDRQCEIRIQKSEKKDREKK